MPIHFSEAPDFWTKLLGSETITLLTATDPNTGEFSDVANGARLETADGLGSFIVNYGPASPYGANNLVLSQGQSVPEPSMWMMFGVTAVLLCGFRRIQFVKGTRRMGAHFPSV